MGQVVMYTDGASRGNPGPGGYGCVMLYTVSDGTVYKKELSCGYRETTNNRMEIMGVIAGLEALTRPCEVLVYSDSQYVVNAFKKGWLESWQAKNWLNSTKKPVKNKDLWLRLLKAQEPHKVSFDWVKGHNGDLYNERADELATSAADSSDLLLDVIEN